MKIWLINPFSDLPNEGASEGRFCCLARLLVEQGHTVTWWTVDFHHRTKAKRSFAGRPEDSPCSDAMPIASTSSTANEEPKTNQLKTGEPKTGKLELRLLPVPEYRKNISLARLRSHRAYGREFAREAADRIKADSHSVPDVIHLSSPPLDCIEPALALKKQYGCRVTVDVMDLWPETFTRLAPGGRWQMEDGRWKYAFRSWLLHRLFGRLYDKARRAYREADGVSAVSQEYLDLVSEVRCQRTEARGRLPADLHLCYVGGDLINSVSRISNPASRSTFIYVGAMTPTYDLDTILEAAERLQANGAAFEVCFAGGGVSEAGLQAEVARRNLGDTVKFLGFLDQAELREALSRSDVGLNAIRKGTFITMPHKLSDYLCAGLAVINSTEGEPTELLDSNKSGINYTPGDAASLQLAMQRYLDDPELLQSHRANARKLAEARFNRTKTYAEMIKFILGET